MENTIANIRLFVQKGLSTLFPSVFSFSDGNAKTRKIVINGGKENKHFKNNRVVNAKYTPWNFLFIMAWHQFSTAMSMYFLLIATLQLFSVITPVHPITSWAPIGVVFTISCVKEGIDDLRRRKRDKAANMKPFTVWKSGREIQECPAAEIRVGDLVLLDDGDEAPCDLFLLRTAGVVPGGIAYVETANLDGEIDLKVRTARPELQELGVPILSNAYGILECENPNADLYRFESRLSVAGSMGPFGLEIEEQDKDDTADSPSRRRPLSTRLSTNIMSSDLSSSSRLLKESSHGKVRFKLDTSPPSTKKSQESDQLLASSSNTGIDPTNIFATPSKSLTENSFESQISHDNMVHFQTGADQFIQAGVVLRRTGWILGVAVYTGSETKLAMSRTKSITKSTRADARINKFVAGVFFVQLICVIIYGILGNKWPGNQNPDYWYLFWNKKSDIDSLRYFQGFLAGLTSSPSTDASDTTPAPITYGYKQDPSTKDMIPDDASSLLTESPSFLSYLKGTLFDLSGQKDVTPFGWMLLPLRFILLSSIVVPISLRVSLDIAKTWAAQQITRDPNISTVSKEPIVDLKKTKFPWFRNIYASTGVWASAASTSIAEDLGVITHVLTDKTGTLTENIMVLAAVSIGGDVFGNEKVTDSLTRKKRMSVAIGRTGFLAQSNPPSNPMAPNTLSHDVTSPSAVPDSAQEAVISDMSSVGYTSDDVIDVPAVNEVFETPSILRKPKLRGPSFDIAPSTSTASSQHSLTIQGTRSQRFESGFSFSGMLTPVPDRANLLELPSIGKLSELNLDGDLSPSPRPHVQFAGPGSIRRALPNVSSAAVETDLDGSSIPPLGQALRGALRNKNPRVMAFLRGLALCNTVSPEYLDATPAMSVQERRASLSLRASQPVVRENTSTRVSPLRLQVPRERSRCLQFASSSPDEEALVHGAATAGVILSNRRTSSDGVQRITISYNSGIFSGENPIPTNPTEAESEYSIPQYVRNALKRATKEEEKPDLIKTIWINDYYPESTYEILSIIEFTPDRRRMSVLVRCSHAEEGTPEDDSNSHPNSNSGDIFKAPLGTIFLITKGADDVIIPRTIVGAENHGLGVSCKEQENSDTNSLIVQNQQCNNDDASLFPVTLSHLEGFSEEGLRTLLVAARIVPQEEYDSWKPRFDDALRIIGADKRESAVAKLAEEMERDLTVLGVTAIEDRLGPDVPYAISTLQAAGIKVWMLTGDKASTALQIGRSAGFFGDVATDKEPSLDDYIPTEFGDHTQSLDMGGIHRHSSFNNTEIDIVSLMKPRTSTGHHHRQSLALPPIHVPSATKQKESSQIVYHISGRSSAAVLAEINIAWEELVPPLVCGIGSEVLGNIMDPMAPHNSSPQHIRSTSGVSSRSTVLLIQGHTLPYILANKAALDKLLQAATAASAVIACRCTPAQKSSLVRALKDNGATVLAIGDGGNDVAMIQEAHVGVGISGREGQQAARAGDYSIAQFSFLVNLLLLHGRYAHWRTSIVACFTFARCAAVAALQLFANSACGFSGCSLLDAMSLTTYNVLYTSLPGLLLCLDVDRHPDEVIKYPHLYFESAGNPNHPNAYLSMRRMFLWWGVRSVWQAACVYFITVYAMGIGGGDPASGDLHSVSAAAFLSLVLIQLITAIFESFAPTALQYLLHFGIALLCVILMIIRSVLLAKDTALGVGLRLLSSPLAIGTIVVSTVVALLPWTVMATWTEGKWKDGKGIKDRNIRVQPSQSTVHSLSRFIAHKLDENQSFLSTLPMAISQFLSFRSNSRQRSTRTLFQGAFGKHDHGKKGKDDESHYHALSAGNPGVLTDRHSGIMISGHDGNKYSEMSDAPASTSITIDGRPLTQDIPKPQMLRRGNASSTTPIGTPEGEFSMNIDNEKARHTTTRPISNTRKSLTPNKPRSKSPSPSNSASNSLVGPLVHGIKSLWQPGKADDDK